jgi:hypothetical protein
MMGVFSKMGPAAWKAVGRAMALALGRAFFSGSNNIVRIAARQIQQAIVENDLASAKAMMQDLARRHQKIFEAFLKKYRDELPEEALAEFKGYANE